MTTEQTTVYLYLLAQGASSVLDISRGLKTGRTKLYPLLEDLARKQLVSIHERHYGTTYEPADLNTLDFLVTEAETRAHALRSSLPAALAVIGQLKAASPTGSRVQEYRGVDGLKQMNYNLGRATSEYRVFELANLDKHQGIPRYFAEKQRQDQVDRKIMSYDLTNNSDWHIDTKVAGYEKFSRGRFIDPLVFEIKFESFIYDNCVGLLNYDAGDIFGMEIHNPALAAQQKQLFDLLWDMGREL